MASASCIPLVNYVDNLGEEAFKGMREKILVGDWPHKPPFGYRNNADHSVELNPEEWDAVKWMFS